MLDLIDGWYGVSADHRPCVLVTGCVSKGEYIPQNDCSGDDSVIACGWREHRDLYVNVVAKYCRNCHISWAKTTYNPQNYLSFISDMTAFITAPDPATLRHGAVQCRRQYLMSVMVYGQRLMPFAEEPYRDFWANAAGPAEQLRQLFRSSVSQQRNPPPPSCTDQIWPKAAGSAAQ